MSKKLLTIFGCVLSVFLALNIYQGCSNADLKKKIAEDKVRVKAEIDGLDLVLKDALATSEKRKIAAEKSNAEAERYKAEAERIPTMTHVEITELRAEDRPLQEKYDQLEKDNEKKIEVILLLELTIKSKDQTIATLKLTVSGLEGSLKTARSKLQPLRDEIEQLEKDYDLLLKRKTGWLFFGGFAGWGINAAGEKYPTGGLGILIKLLKIK